VEGADVSSGEKERKQSIMEEKACSFLPHASFFLSPFIPISWQFTSFPL
jgi:hypothetical protein